MDRYAVIGNPVEHSLSPMIHGLFAAQTGSALTYEKLPSPVDDFVNTVHRFFAEGGCGLNVTVPFKAQAAAWVSELSSDARDAGVVNTIAPKSGGFMGFNTDGTGLVHDLAVNLGVELAGLRLLLLGAGGAARGIVRPLLGQGLAHITVANRGEARARELVTELQPEFDEVEIVARSLSQVAGRFDVVINATSAGLSGTGEIIDAAIVRGAFCYDLVYGAQGSTPFCSWALSAGADTATDGLGMLVEQAAEAFQVWRGIRPQTPPVLAQMREAQS